MSADKQDKLCKLRDRLNTFMEDYVSIYVHNYLTKIVNNMLKEKGKCVRKTVLIKFNKLEEDIKLKLIGHGKQLSSDGLLKDGILRELRLFKKELS